jgi:hypothetical protein
VRLFGEPGVYDPENEQTGYDEDEVYFGHSGDCRDARHPAGLAVMGAGPGFGGEVGGFCAGSAVGMSHRSPAVSCRGRALSTPDGLPVVIVPIVRARYSRGWPGGRGRPRLGAARLPGGYGVIAMATGSFPTVIALPALLAVVRIGVTVCQPPLAT